MSTSISHRPVCPRVRVRAPNVPRYDTLGLLRSRRTQVGDLSCLKLRQAWFATQRPSRIFWGPLPTHAIKMTRTLGRRWPSRSC